MTRKLYFATTNEGKLQEARNILDIDVVGVPLEIDEIQSLDPIKVASRKAQDYFLQLKKPIFVEDVSLSFASLNGLPGTYISDFLKTLGNEGLIKLLEEADDRNAQAQATIVYMDSARKEHVFIGKVEGTISKKPKGEGFGWDPIFIPKGESKTFGEMSLEEKNKYSMRAKALKKMKMWLEKNS